MSSFTFVFDEEDGENPWGVESVQCEVEIEYDFSPGEKMVRYYPNGDGYPGSPPSVDLTDFNLISVSSPNEAITLIPNTEQYNAWAKKYILDSERLRNQAEEEAIENESSRHYRDED
jgi:hypothetical protein